MSNFLRTYGTTLGPVGIPMSDSQAYALDAILKQLPESDRQVRKATLAPALTTVEPGERADISWISTEAVDRDREIVLAKGMRDDHFNLNPLVTLGHCYTMPPVGKSLWRKAADHPSGHKGILAKTLYPTRPDNWPTDAPWEPDDTLALIQAGLLNGKSIGFIPAKPPRYLTDDERAKNPHLASVKSVIEEWLLLEYAVCPLSVNPLTTVQHVSKSVLKAMNWPDNSSLPTTHSPLPTSDSSLPTAHSSLPTIPDVPFTTEAEIAKAIAATAARFDPESTTAAAVQRVLDKHQGLV